MHRNQSNKQSKEYLGLLFLLYLNQIKNYARSHPNQETR